MPGGTSRTYVCYRLRNLPPGATSPKTANRDARVFKTPEKPPGPASVSSRRLFAELDLYPDRPRVMRHCRGRLADVWRPPAHGHARYHQSWELREEDLEAFLTRKRLILHGGKSEVRRAVRHLGDGAPRSPDFPSIEDWGLDVEALAERFGADKPASASPDAATLLVPHKGREVEVRVTRRGRFVFKRSEPPESALAVIRKLLQGWSRPRTEEPP